MKKRVLVILVILFFPFFAHAVLPPDIIINMTSQVSQLVTAVGLGLGGVIFAIRPSLRNIFLRIRALSKVSKVIIGLVSVIVISLTVSLFISRIHQSYPAPGSNGPHVPILSNQFIGYKFYSDRFVIVRKDEKNQPLLIDLIINRKENETGGYDHYYLGNIISGNQNGKFYKEGISPDQSILPNLFFASFNKVKAIDHSARDTYTFSFDLLGETYTVSTDELNGDFITKNEIEYTSYVSSGNATVTTKNGTFSARVMHQGTYSDDYRPKIFFDDKGEIKSETIQLILWDEKGNFYLVDRSNVFEVSPAYSSHLWALFKDTNGNTKKVFAGEVHKTSTKSNTIFTAIVPHFNFNKINAKLTHRFAKKQDKGWVEAQIELPTGTVSAYGLGYYHEYGIGNPLQ